MAEVIVSTRRRSMAQILKAVEARRVTKVISFFESTLEFSGDWLLRARLPRPQQPLAPTGVFLWEHRTVPYNSPDLGKLYSYYSLRVQLSRWQWVLQSGLHSSRAEGWLQDQPA